MHRTIAHDQQALNETLTAVGAVREIVLGDVTMPLATGFVKLSLNTQETRVS